MGKKRITKQTETETLEEAKLSGGKPLPQVGKEKKIRQVSPARVYVSISYNNTLISVTDSRGDVVVWSTAGSLGFRGPKKATPYAASKVVDNIFEKLGNTTLGKVYVYIQGAGSGRDATIRALSAKGLDIVSLQDTTPLPHNGCRPPKARRV